LAAFKAFQASITLLLTPRVAAPYLIYLAFQMLLLALYLSSNSGPLARFWVMPLRNIPPEALGHYPAHLRLIPPVIGRMEMILEVILKVIFHGATVLLVASAVRRRRGSVPGSFSSAARRYPALVTVSLISSAVVYAVVLAGQRLAAGMTGPAMYAVLGGGIAAGLVAQSLFVYVIPNIMIEGMPAPSALAAGISLSLRTFTKTFMLVGFPFLLTIPTVFLDMKADIIATRLSPEFMIHIHIASRIMELVSTYLITASAVVVFQARKIYRPAGTEIDLTAL
jgi:hypothetical protein